MPIGTAKKSYHKDTGSRLYASIQRLSHKNRRILGAGSLADVAYYRPDHPRRYYNLPYLEAQTQ